MFCACAVHHALRPRPRASAGRRGATGDAPAEASDGHVTPTDRAVTIPARQKPGPPPPARAVLLASRSGGGYTAGIPGGAGCG